MKKITKTIAVASCMLFSTVTIARENITSSSPTPPQGQPAKLTAVCLGTTAVKDLNINNVRARILVGGDMWWDQGLQVAQYEVPNGSGVARRCGVRGYALDLSETIPSGTSIASISA